MGRMKSIGLIHLEMGPSRMDIYYSIFLKTLPIVLHPLMKRLEEWSASSQLWPNLIL